jgi:hypothetical protein
VVDDSRRKGRQANRDGLGLKSVQVQAVDAMAGAWLLPTVPSLRRGALSDDAVSGTGDAHGPEAKQRRIPTVNVAPSSQESRFSMVCGLSSRLTGPCDCLDLHERSS